MVVTTAAVSLLSVGFSAGWLAQARFMESPVSVVCEKADVPVEPPRPTPVAPLALRAPSTPREPVAPFSEESPPEAEEPSEAEPLAELEAEALEHRLGAPPVEAPPEEGPALGDQDVTLAQGETWEVRVVGRILDVRAEPPILTWSATKDGLRLFATTVGEAALSVETEEQRVTVAVTVRPTEEEEHAEEVIELPPVRPRKTIRLEAISVVAPDVMDRER